MIDYFFKWIKWNYKNRKLQVIVPTMAPRHYRTYFRMYSHTLNSIISYLALPEPFTTMLIKDGLAGTKKLQWFVFTYESHKVIYQSYDNNFLYIC